MIRDLPASATLAVALLVGCDTAAPASPIPITIDNETDVAVGLYVGGNWVGTYPAGASVEVSLPSDLRLPTTVELRSPSDAVLVEVAVNEDQHAAAEAGGYGGGASQGLPCGTLTLLVGRLTAGEALAPAASLASGACP